MPNVENLQSDALRHLEQGNAEKALRIGTQLCELRWTGGFEIQALAYLAMDDMAAVVRVLEEGVAVAPSVWRLWQLLGNTRDSLGETSAALRAYEAALGCPAVDSRSVRYNRAVCLVAADRNPEAREDLESVLAGDTVDEISVHALSAAIEVWAGEETPDVALRRAREVFQRAMQVAKDNEEDAFVLADLEAQVARAELAAGNRDRAAEITKKVLDSGRVSESVFTAVREIHGEQRSTDRVWHFTLEGTPKVGALPPSGFAGFIRHFVVQAATKKEAVEFASGVEPHRSWADLSLDEIEDRGPAVTDSLTGVYQASGAIWYRE